jgi:hypothetical protein
VLEVPLGVDTDTATLAWLEDALGCVYAHGQTKALAYLEAVMDDAVFEMEIAERRASLVG